MDGWKMSKPWIIEMGGFASDISFDQLIMNY